MAEYRGVSISRPVGEHACDRCCLRSDTAAIYMSIGRADTGDRDVGVTLYLCTACLLEAAGRAIPPTRGRYPESRQASGIAARLKFGVGLPLKGERAAP